MTGPSYSEDGPVCFLLPVYGKARAIASDHVEARDVTKGIREDGAG